MKKFNLCLVPFVMFLMGCLMTPVPVSAARSTTSGQTSNQTALPRQNDQQTEKVQVQPGQQTAPAQEVVRIPAQASTPAPARTQHVIDGGSLSDKLLWLEENAVDNAEYRIEVSGNEMLNPFILAYQRRKNITIHLVGGADERGTISLQGNGTLLTIDAEVTLILENGITLKGHERNNASLVTVNAFGTLIMNNGVEIINNKNNNSGAYGGGVYVANNGTFTMTGGLISNNISSYRGGGGVYVNGRGTFIMSGGKISGNTAGNSGDGGGVNSTGTFTMSGGEISGNTSGNMGGGVYSNGTFTKTGGTIYGFTEGNINNNTATEGIRNRDRGHAVYVSGSKKRESTAGPNIFLDSSKTGSAGGWVN